MARGASGFWGDRWAADRLGAMNRPVSPAFSRLRIAAGIMTALIFIQAGMSIMMLTGNGGPTLYSVHGWLGYAAFLTGIVATVFAWQASKVTGSKGTFFHALSLPILMILQIGLGEMAVTVVHIILGLALLVGSFALFAIAGKGNRPAETVS